MPVAAGQRRLFFALWPEAGVLRQLLALQRQARAISGGRAMKRDTLHMTLAFLGGVAADRVATAEAVAASLEGAAFTLELDRLALWRHNHIVWAGTDVVPEPLAQLAGDLAEGLGKAGFALEKRPFAAHVTLLRNATASGELPQARTILWPVRDFVLVESKLSVAGACYEVIGRWQLS